MVISKKSIIFQGFRGSNIFQGGGGGIQLFPGGGVQVLISIKTHITCVILQGRGSKTPIPPLDPHMIACKCKLPCNKFKTESEPHMGRCINYIIIKI